ncbi:hypothetical protein PACTADRAFT_35867 [Pachysolen tannophilus NRRL Y-2460]|uniref:Uncharacterized protein n=1 Tax=Pachysolen tannophilus NRRL Y-2460 TaxID=669874 RepID=A0A1E4TND3_PACTA|nr:hypothetical protein PACTADRAFT_35867 [Pachysolen tannophilus NRRL Y-2460]
MIYQTNYQGQRVSPHNQDAKISYQYGRNSPVQVPMPAKTSTRSKRRLSDDQEVTKKTRSEQEVENLNLNLNNDNCRSDYPTFIHPEGGYIQFTPEGNIRTFFKDNVRISQLEKPSDSRFNLQNTHHGIDGYKLHLGNNSNTRDSGNSVESYMTSGYSNGGFGPVQSYDCDSDIDDDNDEDYEMR